MNFFSDVFDNMERFKNLFGTVVEIENNKSIPEVLDDVMKYLKSV